MNVSQTFESNSWLDGCPSRDPRNAIAKTIESDWLVIGAGITGISAAQRLALFRPNDQITLVDAKTLSDGGLSRSSGFVVPLGQFDCSVADNLRLYNLGQAGIEQLRTAVEAGKINCDWNASGRLIGARGSSGVKSLGVVKRALDQLQAPYDILSPEQVESETGMAGYLSCLRQCGTVLVNPALLHRGLLSALPNNVDVYERSPVVSLARSTAWRADCPGGVINAKNVLVATNGFASTLGIGKHRVFPMRTFVTAFRSDDLHRFSSSDKPAWGMTSVERVGSSLRLVKDRIFVRNTAVIGSASAAQSKFELKPIADFQLKAVERRFPRVKFEIENTWSGVIGVSANGGQLFGKLDSGLFASCGYNGHGIAQGAISGSLLADLALGRKSDLLTDIQTMKRPNWIPSGMSLRMGVSCFLKFLNWRFSDEI